MTKLTFIANVYQHRDNDVIRKHKILSDTENGVPQNQQVEEIKFAAEQKAQPSTEKSDNTSQYLPFQLILFINEHAKQRQGNFELQQMIMQVQVLLGEDLVADDVQLMNDFDLGALFAWRLRAVGTFRNVC